MSLKNYTSEVPASKSISAIEEILVGIGATNVMKKYEGGKLSAISFLIMVNPETILPFRLPANVEAIYNYLTKDLARNKNGNRHGSVNEKRWRDQAERTAWKLIYEWVEIQASMIKLKQAEVLEIFLPYVYDVQKDKSYYQKLKEGNFKALPQQ